MNYNLIAMTSITYAQKAKSLLNAQRMYCEIQKTPSEYFSGCGYSIRVKDDISKVTSILRENGVKYKQTASGYRR
ncbi:MAG: DUF3343 domain-containing protein [Ruminococcus sp.]|nr:DUF3343 domain-containing protein [Ruminococcus sp.]MCD7773408.1 DUF3343 domain-containing protein [Ruminococcus sp.]